MTDTRFKTLQGVCNYCYKSTPERTCGLDESIEDWQAQRRGTGRDPKNRKRLCPHCSGTGRAEYCYVCGEKMRCNGRDPKRLDGFMGDPPPCLRRGRSDRRTYYEIIAALQSAAGGEE